MSKRPLTRERKEAYNPTSRKDVYDAINGERAYQDSLAQPNEWMHDGVPSLPGELVMMNTYLRKAFDTWTVESRDEPILDIIRKVTAMGVRAMENYGAPRRNNPK